MSQKKIAIRLFYVLLLASLFSAGWTYNSIARAPQSSFYTGESINAAEPGLTVVPISTMQTSEAGGTASFTVALSSQPTANVTVNLSSSDITEGTITIPLTPTLSFTKGNWDSPKSVTVTGQNDDIDDADIPYNIVLDPASSGDPLYDSLPNVNVGVTNIDNDIAGLTVDTTPPMQTSEAGGTASFTVALSSQPTANVTVAVSSSNINEGIVTAPLILPLTFTTVTWNIPQPVIVKGVDDSIVDNNITYNIVLNPASVGDLIYNGLQNVNVGVTNNDRLTVVTPPLIYTTESGGTASFTVALSSQPIAAVTVTLSSDTPAEGIITTPPTTPPLPPTLTFTIFNWNTPQTVIITGVDDCENDGDKPYKVTFSFTSPDPIYNKTESLVLINYDAPAIGWVEPVETEQIYFSDGFSPIQLEVVSLCPEPISKVRFYRWAQSIGDWVNIGEDLTPPYEIEILPEELESGWNQVFSFAFGPPNPVQTFSKHERILILKDIEVLVALPLINK